MRRALTVFALALLAVGALSGTAAAKEGGVDVSSTPAGTEPGDPWTPTLRLIEGSPELLAQAKPGVAIENVDSGERIMYDAGPTDDPAVFTVEVVFPEAGWWTVEAYSGIDGRGYPVGGQWLIEGPEAAPPVAGPSPTGSSFPVWPAVAGGSAFLLAAAGAALLFRRQRFGLSH
jgi:hypothetical protein